MPEQPDLVFVSGIDSHDLLLRRGVVQQTVRERTHEPAKESTPSIWAASRPLVRAGRCGTWGYVIQSAG
ncbi:hypothetical protein OHS70_37700 [Streptomyces sp. NBC_00390]|uniref:hypothetical protein n=1 Tax=Streptomyces sp. NBC_00390 TaxID=2975736 RepID=UPI002E211EA6